MYSCSNSASAPRARQRTSIPPRGASCSGESVSYPNVMETSRAACRKRKRPRGFSDEIVNSADPGSPPGPSASVSSWSKPLDLFLFGQARFGSGGTGSIPKLSP